MDLYSIEEQKKSQLVIETYKRVFKAKFQCEPVLDKDDYEAVNSLVRVWTVDRKTMVIIVERYFELDDKFIRNGGFPLRFLKSRINAIAAGLGKKGQVITHKTVSTAKAGYVVEGCPWITEFVIPVGFSFESKEG